MTIEEKLSLKLPNAKFGENSGLPFIAVPVADLATSLPVIEKILTLLGSSGVRLPVLLDLKNDYIELRYAITAEQREILESATN